MNLLSREEKLILDAFQVTFLSETSMPVISRNTQRVLRLVVLAVFAFIGLHASSHAQEREEPNSPQAAPAVTAESGEATQDPKNAITPGRESDGLSIDNAQTSLIQNAFIAAPLPGMVDQVFVREGDIVGENAPLVKLKSELAKKELIAAQASFEAAQLESENDVDLRYARRAFEVRENELKQSLLANKTYAGAVSPMELEKVRLEVDQAALAMEQADHEMTLASAAAVEKEAAVSIAQTKLDQHRIETSVSGMVVEVDVEVGEWVESGKPVVRVISLNPLRVECFVDGRSHGRELVGREVEFLPNSHEHTLRGAVTFVSPESHPVTGQIRLWASVKNPDNRIGSGVTGRLIIK